MLGATGALAGCTGGGPSSPSPAPSTPASPDAALLVRVRAGEQELVAAYEAALAAYPALHTRLAPALAHHRKHLVALSPATTGSGTTPTPSAPPAPPASAARVLARLRQAESRRSEELLGELASAGAPLRTLLASVAAAEAAHAALLEADA